MKLAQQQMVFAANVGKLIQHIFHEGYSCTLGEVLRTEEQASIYAKEGKGIKDSLHCKKLAIDINLFSNTGEYLTQSHEYELFGSFWESLNPLNKWGGRWKRGDGNHFEMDIKKD